LKGGDKVILGTTVLRFDWLDALEQGFHDELERLINIDELTGLPQKRRFDTDGTQLVETTLRDGRPITVLMMDLDGIKRINDSHGHVFGAHCIAEAGALVGRVIKGRGIATRWGGDEYSAVLPGLDRDGGTRVAEEILAAIRVHAFVRDGIRVQPGMSIGIAVGPEQGADLETLQRRADEALYRAKRAGKGRVST
jgi:two-component system cell cycle response regulator